jgi:hypothetical protein
MNVRGKDRESEREHEEEEEESMTLLQKDFIERALGVVCN